MPGEVEKLTGDPSWLKAYREYSIEAESPDSYHLWTALSVLASAVRRNVWIDQGIFTILPNLYVVLTGESGKMAKSTTLRLGRDLLLSVEEVLFGPDSLTREELIQAMAQAGSETKYSAITLHSSELSSLIDPSGVKMVQFLTDIFDGDYKWRYSTKASGRFTIHNPVVNILACTTPSWISEDMPTRVVEHGFTSRTVFVYEDELRKYNPRPKAPDPILTQAMKLDLNEIALIEGPITFRGTDGDYYDEVYHKIMDSTPTDYRIRGFHWRVARAHILKIAALVGLSTRGDRLITDVDLDIAYRLLTEVQRTMGKTFSSVGKYEFATDLERILADLIRAGSSGLTSQQIYESNRAIGPDGIVGVMTMLIKMGKAESSMVDGNTVYFARTESRGSDEPQSSEASPPGPRHLSISLDS